MAIKDLPDQAYLRECFSYDPRSGVLTWRIRPPSHFPTESGMRIFNSGYSGKEAGNIRNTGYRAVAINGRHFLAHRIIWALVTGDQTTGVIDHINRDPSDNRWENLRKATPAGNSRNKRVRKDSQTRLKGVYNRNGRFMAMIRLSGILVRLGRFGTPEAAHAAYCAAAKRHFGEFWSDGT